LLALTQKGLSRQEAYKIIQSAATKSFNTKNRFEDIIEEDTEIKKYLNKTDLEKLLYSENKISHIDDIFREAFET
ncbi:uncharacterized protein METZ01_LOCUS486222, partial [marine metagenome]